MERTTARRRQQVAELEHQLEELRDQQKRDRRALEVLYNVSLACRGRTSFRAIFEATYRELTAVFPLDACYIALCHTHRPDLFRAALLVDEGQTEYVENTGHGVLTGMLVRERAPLLFSDLAEERARLDEAPEPFGDDQKRSRAWMGVPLMLGQDAVGVISVQSYQAALYDATDLDLLQRLGNVVAVALENVNLGLHQRDLSLALAQRVTARTQELTTLGMLAAEMVLQQPLPHLLDRALSLAVPLLGLAGGSVRLLDEQRRNLILAAHQGFPDDYVRVAASIPLEDSPQGRVVRENRPQVVESDLPQQLRYGAAPPFESVLSVPLRNGERVVGTLNLLGKQAHTFDEQQVDLAQVIGNQIAIAVENARLFAERERQIAELQALGDISHAISTALDLPTLLRQVHESLRGFMKLDTFVMIVYDPQRQVIAEGIGIDLGQEYSYLAGQPPPPESLMAWVLRNGRTLHFRNLPYEIGGYPELRQITVGTDQLTESWMGVPLFDRDGPVIGAICVQSYTSHAFSERDEGFLVSVAGQVALHVRNVRLLTQRERQIRELDAIGRIGQLVSASFDLDEMLDGVYQTLEQATSASVFYLLICEPDTHVVTNAVFVEQGEHVALDWNGRSPSPGSMTAWIIGQREPLLLQDRTLQRDELLARGITPHPTGPGNFVRSWVGVPLLAKDGELIGVLSLQDYQAYRYDDQTIDFLSQVASHVSLAVQKVRLFEERQRQLEENARLFAQAQAHAAAAERQAHRMELVHRISLVLSSRLDQQEVLDLAAQEVVRLFWADHTGIVLFDADGTLGTVVAEYPPSGARDTHLPLLGNLIIEELIETRRPVYIDSVETDLRATSIRDQLRPLGVVSLIIVPLVSRGRLVGSLGLDSIGKPRSFGEEEQNLLLTVAASIAAAIDNARLFTAEQEARRTADTLREVARVLSSSFDPGEVLQLILRELQSVIAYDTASVMLIEGQMLRSAALRDQQATTAPEHMTFRLDQWSGVELVIERRQPVVIADTLESPYWTHSTATEYIRSWLGVPLITKGHLIGVLNINSRKPDRFTQRDAEVALAFANQAAVAMENARLYQESVTRLEQELEIARQIQSNLFPRTLPQVQGLTLAATCLPARETGGDFYDVVTLDNQGAGGSEWEGSALGIMVGDVSGKSIPAAMLMAVARSIARSEARDHRAPEAVMRETNRLVALDIPPRTFVALCYATLDVGRRRLALANAGQLAPLRRRADGHVEYLEVHGPKFPLGIGPDVAYVALDVDLEPEDVLIFYTDGIVEAQDSSRVLFGFERLEALVGAYGHLPPPQLIERVLAAITEFIGPAPQHDDMTLVVLRVE